MKNGITESKKKKKNAGKLRTVPTEKLNPATTEESFNPQTLWNIHLQDEKLKNTRQRGNENSCMKWRWRAPTGQVLLWFSASSRHLSWTFPPLQLLQAAAQLRSFLPQCTSSLPSPHSFNYLNLLANVRPPLWQMARRLTKWTKLDTFCAWRTLILAQSCNISWFRK